MSTKQIQLAADLVDVLCLIYMGGMLDSKSSHIGSFQPNVAHDVITTNKLINIVIKLQSISAVENAMAPSPCTLHYQIISIEVSFFYYTFILHVNLYIGSKLESYFLQETLHVLNGIIIFR